MHKRGVQCYYYLYPRRELHFRQGEGNFFEVRIRGTSNCVNAAKGGNILLLKSCGRAHVHCAGACTISIHSIFFFFFAFSEDGILAYMRMVVQV